MCDHCGCRQGAIGELMDQHEQITAVGAQVRHAIAGGDEPAAREALDELVGLLEPHVVWEEAGLFARMRAQGDFADHVASLEDEHVALYAALDSADEADGGWAAAVVTLLDDLDRHIYRENFGLFPGAIAVLDAEDWDAVDAARRVSAAG